MKPAQQRFGTWIMILLATVVDTHLSWSDMKIRMAMIRDYY